MKKVLLIVSDGFGEGKDDPERNAVVKADMPFYKSMRSSYPTALLEACGNDVGLPAGSMGGSEVGHMTISSGRIVWQPLERINRSFEQKDFVENVDFVRWKDRALSGAPIHLLGMISDAGVHSHIDHLYGLLDILKSYGITKNVYIHAISDGRDVEPRSISRYVEKIIQKIQNTGVGQLVSICGRYYAMDRDKNWDRTQEFYQLLTERKGTHLDLQSDIDSIFLHSSQSDYYIPPYICGDFPLIDEESLVLFWNFRSDRAEQITQAFVQKDFSGFERRVSLPSEQFLAFGPFTLGNAPVLFPPPQIKNTLGEIIANMGLNQLRIAETDKFAHLTFFFNAQRKDPFVGEERVMIPSPKCASYAEQPEMSSREETRVLIENIEKEEYEFIACNFASSDLVAHSGDFDATVVALECLDECLAQIIPVAQKHGYEVVFTADHGNCDDMKYDNGDPKPSHSFAPVPCILVSSDSTITFRNAGGLQDVAPTILALMGIEKPREMTGSSLML